MFVNAFYREPDETHVEEGDSEVEGDMNDDEFAECVPMPPFLCCCWRLKFLRAQ